MDIIEIALGHLNISEKILKSRKRSKEISTAIGVAKSLVSKVNIDLLKSDEDLYDVYYQIENETHSTFQP